MRLFPFAKKARPRSFLLIDIGSSSVGGGYARANQGEQPTIFYTVREPVLAREGESLSQAMIRTLDLVCENLVKRGAPVLRREMGSASVDEVLVSASSPWQETDVLTEHIEKPHPFTFTASLLDEIADRAVEAKPGRRESGRSVIATLLNGYEVSQPLKKKAKRADVVLLSSTIQDDVAEQIERAIRRHFHRSLHLTAFAPAAFTVFRDMFPHEKDFLILSVSGEGSDIVFVKHSLLVSVETVPTGLSALLEAAQGATSKKDINRLAHRVIDPVRNQRFATKLTDVEEVWLKEVAKALASSSTRHALPRTLFLIADPGARGYLARLLDRPTLRSLWLSDEPLTIVPVEPRHINPHVRTRGDAEGDTSLSLLALYAARTS